MTMPTFPANHITSSDDLKALLPYFVRKGSDQAVTSSTTLVNDNELFLTLLPNATYSISTFIIYDGAGASGLKLAFTGPTNSTMAWWTNSTSGGNTTFINSNDYWGYNDLTILTNSVGCAGAGSKGVCRPGGFLTTGATSGTVQFQWAQGTSSATATHVFAGSCMVARRVG